MKFRTLTLEDREWFESNRFPKKEVRRGPGDPNSLQLRSEVVTSEMFTRLSKLQEEGAVFCCMGMHCYGSEVNYYTHPTVNGGEPEKLVVIAGRKFRELAGHPETEGFMGKNITHTPPNLEFLKFYRIEQKEDPHSYAY